MIMKGIGHFEPMPLHVVLFLSKCGVSGWEAHRAGRACHADVKPDPESGRLAESDHEELATLGDAAARLWLEQ
jgi:hypothetical protein